MALLVLVIAFLISPLVIAVGLILWALGSWLLGTWIRHRERPRLAPSLGPYRSALADEAEQWLRAQ